MGQYRPMFNISMEHTYYSSGKLLGVELKPTAETSKLMLNANLVSRSRPDGVTVFYDDDYIDTLRLYAGDSNDPLKMNFECEVSDQSFHNFTGATTFSETQSLFFDSSNTDSSKIGKKYLHVNDHVSSADLAENFSGPQALKENHSSILSFSSSRALLFDSEQTAANGVGKITLGSDPREKAELTRGIVQAGSPQDRRQPTLGLVSIRVSAEELEKLRESPTTLYNDYHIRFKARETHWKYLLVGEANKEGAFVKDADGEIDFEFLGEELLANGQYAKVYISKQSIPLQDRAKHKIQLLIPKNNRNKILVKRLAVASAKRINKVNVEDRELFVSEIYINF